MTWLLSLIGSFFGMLFLIAIALFIFAFLRASWKNRNTSFGRLFRKNMKAKKRNQPIKIYYFDFEEFFKNFPFNSDFHETEKFLMTKTQDRQKTVKILELIYNCFEDLFLNWSTNESVLLSKFDEIQISSPIKLKNAAYIKYYNDYLDKTSELFLKNFTEKIMPAYIARELGLDCNLIFGVNSFDQVINDSKKIINNYCEQRCREVTLNATREISKMIEDLFGRFQRNFNGSSSFNQSNANRNNQSNWGNQKAEPSELEKAYKIMDVNEKISDRDLKKTYLRLAKEYHPDVNKSVYAKEKMAKINSAYDTICKARGI
ncbi:hypothetical protein SSABA_v1c02110 [Spiroplasma sabaudiense Ar-1343]|uniref:J domain-containing protein n=1 Tax=Spiroplasma sabaudiense Ar-1343 TaxID=1276257 RepID=W6A900_9MOLU|nr:DnaJ domain-containing protein [Spiroplasma sabaudiense]AHI53623.1 hypothetical protein SSABA_v1c02110 [Spiroplasma sabaudiense Ar-1343]